MPLVPFVELPWDDLFARSLPGEASGSTASRQLPGLFYAEIAPTPVAAPKPVKLSWKEERELEALPDRIAALEDEQTAAQARLNDPATYKDAPQEIPALNTRLQALEAEIEAAMLRWEELESRSGKK